jgi:lipopolysaccharide export system permease protein
VGLLDRYLAKEILQPFAAALLFLTQLLIATTILGQAQVLFGSGVAFADVGLVVLSLIPYFVGFVGPIAFLLGGVVGVGRLAEDREVIALSAAGVSPLRLARVPVLLGILVAGAALVLSLQVEPLSLRAARLRMNEVVKRNVTNDVRPGTFYDQIPGYTLYAEKAKNGRWENVLIHDRTNASAPVLALARRGRLEPAEGGDDMRLALADGEVHRESAGDGGDDEYALARFRTAEVIVGLGTALSERTGGITRTSREQTVQDYLEAIAQAEAAGKPRDALRLRGSLHRKLSQALVVIPFALLAVPLGAWRRGGKAFGILSTFGVIVLHYLLLRGGEGLVQRGLLPPLLGLQLPNLVLGGAAAVLLAIMVGRGAGAVR